MDLITRFIWTFILRSYNYSLHNLTPHKLKAFSSLSGILSPGFFLAIPSPTVFCPSVSSLRLLSVRSPPPCILHSFLVSWEHINDISAPIRVRSGEFPDRLSNKFCFRGRMFATQRNQTFSLAFLQNNVAHLPHARKVEPQNRPFLSNTRIINGTAGLRYPFLGYGPVNTLPRRRMTSHSNNTGWESRYLSTARYGATIEPSFLCMVGAKSI
jgi:hypothetical protein